VDLVDHLNGYTTTTKTQSKPGFSAALQSLFHHLTFNLLGNPPTQTTSGEETTGLKLTVQVLNCGQRNEGWAGVESEGNGLTVEEEEYHYVDDNDKGTKQQKVVTATIGETNTFTIGQCWNPCTGQVTGTPACTVYAPGKGPGNP